MTYEEAADIVDMDSHGQYRGERSRLVRAREILGGEDPDGESVDTIWGSFDIGGEG